MPDLLEHMYCAQQINIPPNLPYILKQYAKAAIRTQPYDLLYWSAAYFKAKANNLPPPVKERLEYPPFDSPSRLSPGFLRVLHKQLGQHEYVRVEILYEKWLGVCLVKEALDSMLKIGHIQHRVPWLKFVAIAAGHICTSLGKTMVLICEILTDQPDGGAAWIPVERFIELYQFLARLNCGPQPPHVKHVEIAQESPSVSSTQVSSIVIAQEEDQPKEPEEADSTAGLMVWPDIKPEEKKDRVTSPKAADEPGASSELGVEVLDDAKGTKAELITLYPATTTKSQVSAYSESPSKIRTKVEKTESQGESILSHSSLKENEDWLKVQAKNLDEGGRDSEVLDLEELINKAPSRVELTSTSRVGPSKVESAGNEASREGGQSQKKEEEKTEDQDTVVVDSGVKFETSNEEELQKEDSVLNTPKNEETEEPTVEETTEKGLEDTSSTATSDMQEKTEVKAQPKNATFDSVQSEFALDHTITMTNFSRTRDVGYSVVEIRKGRVGDKSLDRINSDEGPLAVDTVHQFRVDSDESIDEQEKESKLPYWDHVPGIGPVIPEPQILAVVEYMQFWAAKQQGMVGPRNVNHMLCPPLDMPPPQPDDVSIY